ncbi:9668_t:CDS:2, partial [Funneliformis caledonium]
MRHCLNAIAKDIQLALFKVFPKVPEIKANAEDIADIYDNLKNNEYLKDYNDTIKEETQEPYSESEDT